MVLHCFRNGYNTIIALQADAGAFNFYHYSLQLFGGVLAYQSYLLLLKCKAHVSRSHRHNRSLYRSMFIIIATSLPTFIFTPIGIVPAAVLVITFICSLVVHKKNTLQKSEIAYIAPIEDFQLN